MEYRRKLFSFPTPYDLDGSRALFLQAIEENVRFHYHSCPEYQKIAQAQGFSPRPLQNEEDLAQLPFLPTILFKRHDLRSMEGKKFLLTATSSGTGGRPSSIQFDMDGVIQSIISYSRSSLPTRFMGFPSYTYFVLRRMEEQGITVKLKTGSKIMLGGGWKQFYTQQVDKKALYALAERVLGVPEQAFEEFFGAVEHPILYCSCPNHRFHVPVYSRVIIRDVHTLQPLPYGCPGLVNLITPMVNAAPLTSVMTDDLGVLHEPDSCGCGISSPWLELLGRVGLKGLKTCAAGAAELLSEVKL